MRDRAKKKKKTHENSLHHSFFGFALDTFLCMEPSVLPWIALKACPKMYCSHFVVLNHSELMVAIDIDLSTRDDIDLEDGIYVYQIAENEWKLFLEYPVDYLITYPSICLDRKQQLLYLTGDDVAAYVVDMNTKQLREKPNFHSFGWNDRKSIMIESEYHQIGGIYSKHHLRWNEQQNTFVPLHEFPSLRIGLSGTGLVYSPRKRQVILFGGSDLSKHLDTIWTYDIDSNLWTQLQHLRLPTKNYAFGYALSADERYLFMLGGVIQIGDEETAGTAKDDSIYIIDVQQWKVMKSPIKCPVKGQMVACTVSHIPTDVHHTLTAAVVAREWKISESLEIPSELISLISQFYSFESLHLLIAHRHWKIDVDILMQGMEPCQ